MIFIFYTNQYLVFVTVLRAAIHCNNKLCSDWLPSIESQLKAVRAETHLITSL